jgi:glycosyltransferase involved in cell wall biosynthesis
MADADPALRGSGRARRTQSIDILAFVPLPFRVDGAVTFQEGVAVFYSELLPRLASAGHALRVLAEAPRPRAGQRREGLPWRVPNLDAEWFAFDYRSGTLPSTRSYRGALERDLRPLFARELERRRPDVVLIGREILTPYVGGLCRAHGLPSVVIAHGVAVRALQTPAYPETERRRLVAALGQVDLVIAVARHLEHDLRGLGVARVRTIANVVDPSRFRPRRKDARLLRDLEIGPDDFVVGHFSVLKPVKRPLDIVESAAIVLRSRPNSVYVIGGAGPCLPEMEKLARRRGISERFRFVGEVDHVRMPRYMNLCDVVVMPSEEETLPLAYREAQASGCVVVASDIPAAREAIVPNRTGALFRKGDVRALAAETLGLLRNHARRRRIAAQARIVVARQTPRQWSREYAEVLRRIASDGTLAMSDEQ